jgi:predicted dinucleotide-utilizing enzyme
MMKKVMLIGYGAMAQAVIERLPPQVALGWIVAREPHHAAIRQQFGDAVTPLDDPLQCDQTPDLVLECASQQAVAQYGEAVLARGWHLAVISTGALADSALEQRLRQAGGRLTLLAGAVAGIDGLAAAKEGGLERVTYQSRKSPASWRGSYAEQLIDLNAVMKRGFSLRAAPAKRRGCFRRMPTWRQPWRWAASVLTHAGAADGRSGDATQHPYAARRRAVRRVSPRAERPAARQQS